MHTRRFGSWETYSWETHSRNSFLEAMGPNGKEFYCKTHYDTFGYCYSVQNATESGLNVLARLTE